MLNSIVLDYSDVQIIVKGTITNNRAGDNAEVEKANERRNQVIIEIVSPFNNYMIEINNVQGDNAKYIDAVISMYNLYNKVIINQKHL